MNNKRRGRRKSKKTANRFTRLSRGKKIGLMAGIVVFLLVVVVGSYIAWAFSKLGKNEVNEDDVFVNEELVKEDLGDGYTNFVLFGSDSRQGNVENDLNTDSIIIISLNNDTKEVKMVSVYRDTLMDLTNGSINKCNSAYARGGATQALSMLNMNLDLQLKKYVTIDFSIVVDIIDILGGIEVNVTEKEVEAMNKYIGETARVAGVEAVYLTEPGLQLLNGAQATTYARIRKGVGDDFARTERQRLVIQKVVEKAVTAGLGTINEMIETAFPRISTNFTMVEILKYAQWFAEYTFGETSGFPFEYGSGTIPGKGSCVYATDLTGDVAKLHEFLYGTVGYTPTSTVEGIEAEVNSIVQSATYTAPTQNDSSSGTESHTQESTLQETPATPETESPTPEMPETPESGNGDSGNTGSTGNSGNTGSTGTGGDTGSTGTGGDTGSTGTGGDTGSTDTGGDTGSTGNDGSTGSTGNGGNTGSTGNSGNTGTPATPDAGTGDQTTTQ